jgi:hypothetical protein
VLACLSACLPCLSASVGGRQQAVPLEVSVNAGSRAVLAVTAV